MNSIPGASLHALLVFALAATALVLQRALVLHLFAQLLLVGLARPLLAQRPLYRRLNGRERRKIRLIEIEL